MDIYAWAPWLFSLLTGLAGWFIRAWYDEEKMLGLRNQIKIKEDDLYHLHEAHELLLNDKERKLGDLAVESEIQQKSINELKFQLKQAEESNKSLLSTVVDSKKNKNNKPKAIAKISTPDPHHTEELKLEKSGKDKSSKKDKKSNLKNKIKEQSKLISKLQSKQDKLKNELKQIESTQPKVKKVPYTIIKTIKISELIDRKKLLKALEEVPLIKSKKKVSEKRIKGKPKSK